MTVNRTVYFHSQKSENSQCRHSKKMQNSRRICSQSDSNTKEPILSFRCRSKTKTLFSLSVTKLVSKFSALVPGWSSCKTSEWKRIYRMAPLLTAHSNIWEHCHELVKPSHRSKPDRIQQDESSVSACHWVTSAQFSLGLNVLLKPWNVVHFDAVLFYSLSCYSDANGWKW